MTNPVSLFPSPSPCSCPMQWTTHQYLFHWSNERSDTDDQTKNDFPAKKLPYLRALKAPHCKKYKFILPAYLVSTGKQIFVPSFLKAYSKVSFKWILQIHIESIISTSSLLCTSFSHVDDMLSAAS